MGVLKFLTNIKWTEVKHFAFLEKLKAMEEEVSSEHVEAARSQVLWLKCCSRNRNTNLTGLNQKRILPSKQQLLRLYKSTAVIFILFHKDNNSILKDF